MVINKYKVLKKWLFILLIIFIFIITGCSFKDKHKVENDNSIVENNKLDNSQIEIPEHINDEENNKRYPNDANINKSKENKTNENQDDFVNNQNGISASNNSNTIEMNPINTTVKTNYNHESIHSNLYYQYTNLSATEKVVYKVMASAMQSCQTDVGLGAYNCTIQEVSNAYNAVIADYPQLFYVAKSFLYSYEEKHNMVKTFKINYTDGKIADQYDDQGNMISKANRNLINQQINDLNSAASNFISTIPISESAIEKEKQIYEYIQTLVKYDKQTAANPNSIVHAYDIYGAACEGTAVCEGYSKLFQYLCYCVGINATPVYGTSQGQAHMWNAVQLDGQWYMVDVTWDDTSDQGLLGYNYFNLTSNEMSKDHLIDYESLSVPSCTSTSHAFYNSYALYISSTGSAPTNYTTVIERLANSSEKYLLMYVGNHSGDWQSYLSDFIYSNESEIQRYIKQKGYVMSFQTSYYILNNYYYIQVR